MPGWSLKEASVPAETTPTAAAPPRGSGWSLKEAVAGSAAVAEAAGVPVRAGLSALLEVGNRLEQMGSQGAGGAVSAFREGKPIEAPTRYLSGLAGGIMGTERQPEIRDEFTKLGFTESPIPEFLENIAGPTGGTAKIARALTGPAAASTLATTAATLPLDLLGGKVLKGASALSRVPKVAEALDVVRGATAPVGNLLSRGYSIPHTMREGVREAFAGARGSENVLKAEFADILDEASDAINRAAKARGIKPEEAEKRVRDLIESAKRDPASVSGAIPEELEAAQALSRLSAALPFEREAASLMPRELGSHLDEAEQAAMAEFTPRIFKEKAAKQLGLDRNATMSDLGTSVPGVRQSDRELLTGQIEKALETGKVGARGPVKDPFQPLVKAFEIKGAQTARSVSNARALSDVAKKFSVGANAAGPGWKKLGDLPLLSGFEKNARASLADSYVHPEVFRYLDDFTREIRPSNIPILQGFLKVWKPAVTTVNPQFISRNMQWNGIIGWIRGNRDPRNWADAATVLGRGSPEATIRGFGKTSAAELRKEMLQGRIIGAGTSFDVGVPKKWIGTKLNQAGEDLSRAAFYIAMRRKGMSANEAAKETILTYFDYGKDASTAFINNLREGAVPFAVWARNILPLTFRTLVDHPSSFAGMESLGKQSAKSAGLAEEDRSRLGPEYKTTIGVTMKPGKEDKPGTFRSLPLSQVGFTDVSEALKDPKRWAMRQLSPAISVPLETAGIIKNAFTGKGSDDIVELPPVAAWLASRNPALAEKVGVTMAGKNRAVGPEWLNAVLRTGGPLGSTVFDLWSDDEKARDRVARWFTGVGVRRNLDPRTGQAIETSIEKRAQKEERSKQRTRQGLTGQIERGER